MGCKDEHEHSVRRLPHIDIRHQVESANEIGAGSMQRIENVFLKGIKAWICMLLPNLRLKYDAVMKMSFSIIQSAVAAIEVLVQHTELEAEDHAQFVTIPLHILSTIPMTIRNRYTHLLHGRHQEDGSSCMCKAEEAQDTI